MRTRPGITFVEILVVVAVLACLLVVALPKLKQSHKESGTGALADLKRIGAAKDQYAADHHKKPGDPVTMEELVNDSYLRRTPHSLPPGSRFVVGSIGTPVTITAEPDHDDHPHAPH